MIFTLPKIYSKKSKLCIIIKLVQHKQELLSFDYHLYDFNVRPTGDSTHDKITNQSYSKHWTISACQLIHHHFEC